MKQTVKLNEKQLRHIISEAIQDYLGTTDDITLYDVVSDPFSMKPQHRTAIYEAAFQLLGYDRFAIDGEIVTDNTIMDNPWDDAYNILYWAIKNKGLDEKYLGKISALYTNLDGEDFHSYAQRVQNGKEFWFTKEELSDILSKLPTNLQKELIQDMINVGRINKINKTVVDLTTMNGGENIQRFFQALKPLMQGKRWKYKTLQEPVRQALQSANILTTNTTTLNENVYGYNSETYNAILNYIKSYGQKGKLPSFNGKLSDYYKPYLEQAYQWASEKLSDIKRDGFEYFKHLFNVYVISKLKFNKRGLIYVERKIDIDMSNGLEDIHYKSVGECWAWKKNNSDNYCSNTRTSLERRDVYSVTLCGYVHPDSVDWLETIYLNSYDMKNETEVRMNDNAQVEVAYVLINNNKYTLGGSYLLNASADKYKK